MCVYQANRAGFVEDFLGNRYVQDVRICRVEPQPRARAKLVLVYSTPTKPVVRKRSLVDQDRRRFFTEQKTRLNEKYLHPNSCNLESLQMAQSAPNVDHEVDDKDSGGHKSYRNRGRKPRNHIKFLRHAV